MATRLPSLPRVCVTVAAPDLAELKIRAIEESKLFGFVELRLDFLAPAALANTKGIAALVRDLRKRKIAAIVTVRSAAAGGKFEGSAEEQLRLLQVAARAGASLLDLEIESAEHLGQDVVRGLHKLAPLMVSFHDYRETPPSLPMALGRLLHFPAELYKLVTQSCDPADNAAVLGLLAQGKGRLVAFTLGEMGVATRIQCLAAGSPFTYAKASRNGLAGIGQIPAARMHNMYRAQQITRKTRVFGVAGHPVSHSLSPAIHNAAFAALGIDAVYVPFDVPSFDGFWKAFAPKLAGLSITMPHKEAAARAAAVRDPLAEQSGAANTLVMRQRRWTAFNTDVAGIVGPLGKRIELKNARVLVAGAGGAARAAVFALQDAGCKITIVGRSTERAEKLAAESGADFVERALLPKSRAKMDLYDAIVHATPVGMLGGHVGSFFAEDELNARVLFETVYTPKTTELARLAKRRGLEVITGAEMFLAQAALQFQLWTKKSAPLKVMEDAFFAALPR